MAKADLHMAMGILSSDALAEQVRKLDLDPLIQDLRNAVGDVLYLEETPRIMIKLAGDSDLALASTRLREILEAVLARKVRSELWYQVSKMFSSKSALFRLRYIRSMLKGLQREFRRFGRLAFVKSTVVVEDFRRTPRRGMTLRRTEYDSAYRAPTHTARNPTKVDKSWLAELKGVKKMVRILLVDRVDDDCLLFLPLCGGPASGKTLLARTIFNDARVLEKFVIRVWVHVSQRFDISKILWEILHAAHASEFIYDDQAILKSHVWEALSNRKYLIVLDDAWSENVTEWYALMEALPPNGTLILTSRIPAVVSSIEPHRHPLKTMNRMLQLNFVHLWEAIRREIEGVLTEELKKKTVVTEFVLQRAHASYFHLPLDLRKCLLYCSVFPLGHEFHPEGLADFLVAEGQISATVTQAQRMCFLQKLFDECFHPVEESDKTTGKRTYWMHRIMHIFAKIVERQPIEDDISSGHTGFLNWQSTARSIRYCRLDNLRYLDLSKNQRYLDLSKTHIEIILHYVSEKRFSKKRFLKIRTHSDTLMLRTTGMANLRYLNLSRTNIESIPSFVLKLQFLQTLILSHCEKLQIMHDTTSMLVQLQKLDLEGCCYLVELPPDMSKMKSLQFLNVAGCSSLAGMPDGMGQLMNLETMLGYIVPNNDGRAISELQPLANLKMLSLESLENISNVADARNVELPEKQELESLAFRWNKSADNSNSSVSEVLACLRPNQQLKTLEIVGYEGNDLPSWITSSDPYLISLVVIRLVGLKNCKTLPPLGLLPLLKIVEISRAETITSIGDSFYGSGGTFLSLEKLTLSYMSNLEYWEQPQGGPVFPCLTEVTIIQCPKLALRVELPSVTKLILWMNNKMLYSSKGALGNTTQNLKHVSILLCQELIASSDCEGLQDLCMLKGLELYGCDDMTYLPRGLQHLSSLRRLTIECCSKLETLPDWLGNLSSLHLLRLNACPMLNSIPEVLRQRRRTKISIKDCPKLLAQTLETAWESYDDEDKDDYELLTDIISDEFGVEESTVNETFH